MKEDWKIMRLGDVASYINGFAFKPEDWSDKGLPIIRIQNLTENNRSFHYCQRKDIQSKYLVHKGDILISWSATLGVFEWVLDDALLNQHIFKVVFDKTEINKQFFKYAIHMSIDEMSRHTNGATMRHIRKGDFDNICIPVPPLSEQDRIVALLDDQFAKIDALKANAASQLQAAKDLFQSALKEMLTPKEGWEESIITSIVRNDCSLSYGIVQPGDGVDCGVPVVRPVDITNRIYVGKDGLKKTTEQISNAYKRTILTGDEILLCVRGTTGLVAIASRELERCNVTRGIVPIRLINRINKKFIYYTFLTPAVQNEFARITTGSTLKQINIKDLRELTIPLPSLPEQERIAARLDAISEKVKALQTNYDQTITLCNDLKQALLKSIFA